MAIFRVVPKTHAECNQLISVLHSKGLTYAPHCSSKPTNVIKPNEPVCIWTNLNMYVAKRDDGFPCWAQTITVNQVYKVLNN
ncbi:DNA/RNA binding protein [Acinetobacter virus vB_AbaP_AGC01]|uniref:DNA/RNA binding protein n=1 Tax=Acinetobacter virus vB_AbaP_AGC01 TaxID=2723754 RepID=A0A6H0X2G4_9CAUD|nr:DNA/RNA binding protein [Acinetobacter virus vB_AbaP_AGC01]